MTGRHNFHGYTLVYPWYPSPVNKKDVGLRIRVDRDLREAFVEACRIQDVPASQMLRDFMRNFVERSSGGGQFALALDKTDNRGESK